MHCAEVREQLSAYYDAELSADARRAVDEHLATCAGCASELDGFRELSALAQNLPEPTPPAGDWAALEQQLHAENAAAPSRAAANSWFARPRVGLAAAALAVVLLLVAGWVIQSAWLGEHDHRAVDFAAYLDAFRESPDQAQELLLTRYQGRALGLDAAAKELGYVPAVSNGLPSDYRLDSVYVWDMPCCKCVQCLCKRSDGATVAIFEHDEEQPAWFGDRRSVDVRCNGKPCTIFGGDKQMAASWRQGRRHLTVIGLRDVDDITALVSQLDGSTDPPADTAPG